MSLYTHIQVAVVLYKTLMTFYDHEHVGAAEAALQFCLVSVFSGDVFLMCS